MYFKSNYKEIAELELSFSYGWASPIFLLPSPKQLLTKKFEINTFLLAYSLLAIRKVKSTLID